MNALEQKVHIKKNVRYGKRYDNSLMDVYYPEKANGKLPVILWIHGGGYVSGDKAPLKEYGMTLAKEGYVVAIINYALAPKEKYPVPVIQANQALQYLQNHIKEFDGDMNSLFIAGDSAGAQIASQVTALAANSELEKRMKLRPAVQSSQVKGVLLYCGMYNMDTVRATKFPFIQTYLWSYTGVKKFETFSRLDELSTVKQVTPRYPPVFITGGNRDRLEPQSKEFMHVLKKKGVETKGVFYDSAVPGLDHEYQFKLNNKYAKNTLRETIEFLQNHQ